MNPQPLSPTAAIADPAVNSVSSNGSGRALIDARRGRLSIDELLLSADELREKAIADDRDAPDACRLWIVNIAVSTGKDFQFGDHRSAFCTIQPFATDDGARFMRDAFESQRSHSDELTAPFEIIGTRADVGRAVFGMIVADDIHVRFLPKTL